MSRIYEALQKAESERKLDRREPEPENPVSTTTVAAVAESEEAVLTESRLTEMPLVSEPYSELSVRRMSTDSLDQSKIPVRLWAPSLGELPALLERGPAV